MAKKGDRKSARMKTAVPVRYESNNLSLLDISKDVSEGGLFLNSPFLDEVGTQANLEIMVPGSSIVLRTTGKVRWHTPVDNINEDLPEHTGMGIEFTNLDPWAEAILKQWILEGKGPVGNS